MITWGQATVEQHRQAAQDHKESALASMQDASRHEAAIDLITERQAACLDQIFVQDQTA